MPATHAIPDLDALLEAVRTDALLHASPAHGEVHWLAVAATGLELHAHAHGAGLATPDPLLLVLFGLLHDCRRENETYDPRHGHRAASVASDLVARGLLQLAAGELDALTTACSQHDTGAVDAERVTIGSCFDADRLHLPRVGITVDNAFISTPAGRDQGLAERVRKLHGAPHLTWHGLLQQAAAHL